MRQHGDDRRADRNFYRIAATVLDDPLDCRIKHAGIIHNTKIKNRERQHNPYRRYAFDAIKGKRAQFRTEPGQCTENHWHRNQRHDDGGPLGHDQRQQGKNNAESPKRKHGQIPLCVFAKLNCKFHAKQNQAKNRLFFFKFDKNMKRTPAANRQSQFTTGVYHF